MNPLIKLAEVIFSFLRLILTLMVATCILCGSNTDAVDATCSISLDRSTCAGPKIAEIGTKFNCSFHISLTVETTKPLLDCGKISNSITITGPSNTEDLATPQTTKTSNFSAELKTFMSSDLLQKNFLLNYDSQFRIIYRPSYPICQSRECEADVQFTEDHAPTFSINVTSKSETAMLDFSSAVASTLPESKMIRVTSLKSMINIIVDAVDQDVFNNNADVFEYSCLREVKVTFRSVAYLKVYSLFSNNETFSENLQERSISELEAHCKKTEKPQTKENQKTLSYDCSLAAMLQSRNLTSLETWRSRQFDTYNNSVLIVAIDFNVSVTSGRTYQQTTSNLTKVTIWTALSPALEATEESLLLLTTHETEKDIEVYAGWSILKILALVAISIITVTALALICYVVVIKLFRKPNNEEDK